MINFNRFTGRINTPSKVGLGDVRLALEELSLRVKNLYENGQDVSPPERAKMLFQIMKINLPKKNAEQIYERAGRILSNSGYLSKFPNVNPEAKPTLKLLKENFPDLKIALVSNAARSSSTYKRMLSNFGIAKYFDAYVISCEVGYLKPRKEIFHRALSLLGTKPQETLHIGDLFRADVVGAAAVGMHACLYTGLWHKYAQYMNPGEHIPKDFRVNTTLEEIERLQDIVRVAEKIP